MKCTDDSWSESWQAWLSMQRLLDCLKVGKHGHRNYTEIIEKSKNWQAWSLDVCRDNCIF